MGDAIAARRQILSYGLAAGGIRTRDLRSASSAALYPK